MQQLHTWSVAMMHTIMPSVCVAVTGDFKCYIVGDGYVTLYTQTPRPSGDVWALRSG